MSDNKVRLQRVSWVVRFARLSILVNIVIGVGMFIMGFYSHSPFLYINGFYNFGIALVNYIPVRGYRKKTRNSSVNSAYRNIGEEYRRYQQMGVAAVITSCIYLIYCVVMIFAGSINFNYNSMISFAVAFTAFVQIAMAIRNFVIMKTRKEFLMEGMSLIGLSTSLISLVLMQSAVMSITYAGDTTFYCGITGLMVGCFSATVGVFMIVHGSRIKNKNNTIDS